MAPNTFALLSVVQQQLDAVRRGPAFYPLPSPEVLTLAMVSYFPAPWTPQRINEVIEQVLPRDGPRSRSEPAVISWGSDPGFSAARDAAGGGWEVGASERGTDQLVGRFSNDDDLVLYRMSFARSHPMPFAWSWDSSNMPALQRAAAAARAAWVPHAQLPYLVSWRPAGLVPDGPS